MDLDPTVSEDQSPPASPTGDTSTTHGLPQETPLVYEETPIVESVNSEPVSPLQPNVAPQPQIPQSPPPPSKQGVSLFGMIKNLILLIILFAIGIGLSMVVKKYFSNGISNIPNVGLKNQLLPTPTVSVTPFVGQNPYANWKSYQLTSGLSKQPVLGISYMLPPDVLAPICDGGNCASSGTYLPGGTRFTVDARGVGQLLPDFRGKILSDLGGREFSVKDTTVAGKSAKEFTGVFSGTTSGGYAFSRIRGVMVEVSDTVSVEFNHFTPTLVNGDFVADDVLFDKILQSIQP